MHRIQHTTVHIPYKYIYNSVTFYLSFVRSQIYISEKFIKSPAAKMKMGTSE